MKSLTCIMKKVLRVWWMTAVCVVLLAGCKTQYVPVETVKTEIVKEQKIQRDSIFVLDSVFVRQANDTVYLTRWRVEYKEALRVDTVHIVVRDSINHVVEVEKPLTKLQELKMNVGACVMWAIPIVVCLYILYRRFKK